MTHQRHVDGVCVRCGFNWSPWCCGKTGAEAILFAMVDAVLSHAMHEAKAHHYDLLGTHALSPDARNAGIYARQMAQHLGWWRSCWPL
jgi:hypothetical protein